MMKIAILGFGVVGSGCAEVLTQNKSIIELPLNPIYSKQLEKVLFDTLVYTLKIKKLKEIKEETKNAEDIARKIKKDEEFIKFLDK